MSISRIQVVKSRFFSAATTARSTGSVIDAPFESHLQAATTQHRRRGISPIVADVEPTTSNRVAATPSEIHGLSSTEKLRIERRRPQLRTSNDVAMSATDKYRLERAQKIQKDDDAIENGAKSDVVQDADAKTGPLSWFRTFFKS